VWKAGLPKYHLKIKIKCLPERNPKGKRKLLLNLPLRSEFGGHTKTMPTHLYRILEGRTAELAKW
jgi:hypothetical protein